MHHPTRLLLTCLLALSVVQAGQAAEFSNAHRKMARHFLSHAQAPAQRALWTQHNALVLGIDPKQVKAKNYVKFACKELRKYGFAGGNVRLAVVSAQSLRLNQLGPVLAQAACDK